MTMIRDPLLAARCKLCGKFMTRSQFLGGGIWKGSVVHRNCYDREKERSAKESGR